LLAKKGPESYIRGIEPGIRIEISEILRCPDIETIFPFMYECLFLCPRPQTSPTDEQGAENYFFHHDIEK